MESELPLWVEYLRALATPAIAILAVVIAVAQWRTAHQRAVLELFERRMSVFSALREAMWPVVTNGKPNDDDLSNFLKAKDQAQFVFGRDVDVYLERLYHTLLDLQVADYSMKVQDEKARQAVIEKRHADFREASDFYKRFPALVSPYARMNQKLPFWRLRRIREWGLSQLSRLRG